MASSIPKLSFSFSFFFLFLFTIFFSTTFGLNNNSSTQSLNSSIKSFCKSTPYPETCFDSLKLSISINISPNIITYLIQTIQIALTEGENLSNLFTTSNIIETQKGSLQDCIDLHQITLSSLQKSVQKIQSLNPRKLTDARTYLSAALTNKITCLEGLESASGPMKPILIGSIITTYQHVSNSLSVLANRMLGNNPSTKNRRLLSSGLFPSWVTKKDRRLLERSDDDYDPNDGIIVATDGSGNFSTISEAINFAPNNSYDYRIIIYIKEGVYNENVEIPSYKPNIVLIGDGTDVTVITGNRSAGDSWSTFRTATLAVSGEGFLARDITIENTAGPVMHQAAALRINADFAALYRCSINGYQDTLYTHSFRQFYRECNISGTIDYIFGNAAVILQGCNIISRMPLPGQFTVITAQSRDTYGEETGISIQNCSVLATEELYANSNVVKSYLGRPWRVYSRTVFIESYIDDFINPKGWTEWSGDQGLDTLYYGEFDNYGPGSGTGDRVDWLGYHVMDYSDAYNFTVSEFITGDEWLESTSFPYDDGV